MLILDLKVVVSDDSTWHKVILVRSEHIHEHCVIMMKIPEYRVRNFNGSMAAYIQLQSNDICSKQVKISYSKILVNYLSAFSVSLFIIYQL